MQTILFQPLLLLALVGLTIASPWGRRGWGGGRGYGGWGGRRGGGWGWGRKRRSVEGVEPIEDSDALVDINFDEDFAGPLIRNKRSPGPWRGGYGYGGYGGWGRGYGGYGGYWG